MKHFSAIITALLITAVIGFGIVVIGVNAMTNRNTVALQNSPNTSLVGTSNTSSDPATSSSSASADVQQLQQQLSDTQAQLEQATQAVQQYQELLRALQQRGVIVIGQDGRIYLP